jgi:7,8-dihydropterin-6-yl-methyl-4-(beta-D-ribofuranosyl)aminobenzene 5'-phosphate synthase
MANDKGILSADRRDVLCGGGTAVFATMGSWLLAGSSPVRADQVSGRVPEIDQLVVTTVVDSYQIAVSPYLKTGNVAVKRFGFALSRSTAGKGDFE